MPPRYSVFLLLAGLAAILTPSRANAAEAKGSSGKTWVPPKTPDGQPDLQGTWTNATITPFERPHLAIQQQVVAHGYVPVFYASSGIPTPKWREALQRMFARRPAGLIMSQFTDMAGDIALARQMGIEHIVLISTRPVEHIPTIIFPSSPPGYLAARHLLERGHRHRHRSPERSSARRDLPTTAGRDASAFAERADTTLAILPLAPTLPDTRSLVETYLTCTDHPTGIYAFNDEHACYLLRALMEREIRVPQEIAVVGTDDLLSCELATWPSLTSICFDNVDAIGKRTVDMLVDLHTGQPVPEPLSYQLVPQLIQRESS